MDDDGWARRLADHVTGSRADFARVFDAVCAEEQPQRYRDFKMIALGAQTNVDAYARAWLVALANGWAEKVVMRGITSNVVKQRALAELACDRPTTSVHPQDGTAAAIVMPQGYTSKMLPWLDPMSFARALLIGSRRICRLEITTDGPTRHGTGFLVGPQTIITNWHVIHPLMDPATGTGLPDSYRRLSCHFDYFDGGQAEIYAVPEEWLVEWSPMAFIPGQNYPNMTAHRNDRLDFAVVRLHGAPGRSRGWFDLAEAIDVPVGRHNPLFVLQHPSGYTLRVSVGDKSTVSGDEIHHHAPTLPGSSGGLCINCKGQLVGLHRAEFKVNEKLKYNIAVSAKAIANAAPHASTPDPRYEIAWRSRNGTPIIGRDKTCAAVTQMLDKKTASPILIVRGKSLSGKSFTRDLIEDRIGRAMLWLVSINARDIPEDARELANAILDSAGVPEAQRELPLLDTSATTQIAWMSSELMPAFRAAIHKHAANHPDTYLWLIIDELDKSPLLANSSRQLLDLLYQDVQQTPELRIVLLGLSGSLPAGDTRLATEEDLVEPGELRVEPVEIYIKCLSIAGALSNGAKTTTSEELALAARIALAAARARAKSEPCVYSALRAFIEGPITTALKG